MSKPYYLMLSDNKVIRLQGTNSHFSTKVLGNEWYSFIIKHPLLICRMLFCPKPLVEKEDRLCF